MALGVLWGSQSVTLGVSSCPELGSVSRSVMGLTVRDFRSVLVLTVSGSWNFLIPTTR